MSFTDATGEDFADPYVQEVLDAEGGQADQYTSPGFARVTVNNGEVTTHVGRGIESQVSPQSEGGVLATARDVLGSVPSSYDVQDSTLVTVDGVEMTADVALSLGYLEKDAHGNYTDVNQQEDLSDTQDNQSNQQQQSAIGEDAQFAQDDLGEVLPQDAIGNIAAELITNNEVDLNDIAQQHNLDVDALTENVETQIEAYTQLFDDAVKAQGMNSEVFVDYLHENYDQDFLNNKMMEFYVTQDPNVFFSLIK
nr:hypothetical protein 15 [Gammaproteobacteria bacterium]